MNYEREKVWLPDFPRTPHLPFSGTRAADDIGLSEADYRALLASGRIFIEEKIDGANCGITRHRDTGEPLVRNRSHILNKAWGGNKATPAKAQWTSVWTWWYRNCKRFDALAVLLGFEPSVYGEWLYAQHTLGYNALPDLFVAYDIYDAEKRRFLDPERSRAALLAAGFFVVPLLAGPGAVTEKELQTLVNGPAAYDTSGARREGIYVKMGDGETLLLRAKAVRAGWKSDDDWNKKPLVKNRLTR